MKQFRVLLLALTLMLIISLVACSSSKEASQSDFLKDMSEGIKSRIASDKNTSTMSEAEIAEYYAELVNCELKKIGKYSDNTV